MIRSENLTGRHLADSHCHFKLTVKREAFKLNEFANRAREDGFEFTITGEDLIDVTMVTSHEKIDALGGCLYLINYADSLLSGATSIQKLNALPSSIDGVRVEHRFTSGSPCQTPSGRTVSQIVSEMILRDDSLSNLRFGVAVSLDNPNDISIDEVLGNSFVTPVFSGHELLDLAMSAKATWRSALHDKAERMHRLLLKRKVAAIEYPDFVFSFLGDLSKIFWTKGLSPDCFSMVPTPANPKTANLVFWSGQERNVSVVAAHKDHLVFNNFRNILLSWEGIFSS